MSKVNYQKTKDTITLSTSGQHPVVYPLYDPKASKIIDLIKEGKLDEVHTLVWGMVKQIKVYAKYGFRVEEGVVFVGSNPLPSVLGERLVEYAEEGFPCEPLLRFWDNLKENPSEDSRRDLFSFLEVNKLTFTEDGHFIAYRRVRSDFKDFYTGTIDNSVGKTPSIPRESVDSNRNNTCSPGLHVAAFSYANLHYNAGSGHLIEVKVNPADVVTVPPDYNQSKMRVCKYEVLSVCEFERTDTLATNEGKTFVAPINSCNNEDEDDYYDEDDWTEEYYEESDEEYDDEDEYYEEEDEIEFDEEDEDDPDYYTVSKKVVVSPQDQTTLVTNQSKLNVTEVPKPSLWKRIFG